MQSIALSGTGVAAAPTIIFAVAPHIYGDAPFTVSGYLQLHWRLYPHGNLGPGNDLGFDSNSHR